MPTLLVGVGWLVASAATTAYMIWRDGEHERILSENVTSIRAAAEMQHILWQMQLDARHLLRKTELSEQHQLLPQKFYQALDRAEASWSTPEERRDIEQIRSKFDEYSRIWSQAVEDEVKVAAVRLDGLASEIANQCNGLSSFNQRLIEERTMVYRTWTQRILWARLLIVICGPLLGLWIGFRVATRVGRRIANIQVSLAGVSDELGTVHVSTTPNAEDLDDIEHQVRNVANRIHDVITDLQETQREAQRNERLAAIGQLAAGVAHGLRNPLTSVKLLVQTVNAKTNNNSAASQQLSVVQDEIHRMEQTIQSLLDFARPPAIQRRRHDLRETIRRAVNLVQGRAVQDQITLEVSSGNTPLWVVGDPEQLHQVFVNLLLNGMDAIPSGGTLRIDVGKPEFSPDESAPYKVWCEVRISDDGPGIPSGLLDRIFEPFVTTKEQGTGLGLAVSRRFVEEHGGRLTASNRSDGGATFTLRLPTDPNRPREDRGSEVDAIRKESRTAPI